MNAAARHLWVAGPTRAARGTLIAAAGPQLTASCHAHLRGPYTGVLTVLEEIVPQAHQRWPQLVDRHAVELHYTLPELSALLGPGPDQLVAITPHEERTRYYGRDWIRAMSQGVITFLLGHAARVHDADPGGRPVTIALDDLHAAEPTAQEFVAILLRRADPSLLRVIAGSTDAALPPELAIALHTWAERVTSSDAPGPEPASGPAPALAASPVAAATTDIQDRERLARAYVASEGSSDEPSERAAYQAISPSLRARLHDARADALSSGADRGRLIGAVPYHRERGSDPTGAGRAALRVALELCVAAGYSAATVDLGMRGRAVCDPDADQQDYCHFTAKAASALISFGRIDDCADLYHELRRRYPLPRVQMTSSNALAILHTRFFLPRDHEAALELGNNARALAELEPDPIHAAYFQVYQDNGLALIEMHRGNLERAYHLVDAGLQRLDRELPNDRYLVHRSQLMHNRARVLLALGRWDEAYADFTRLIAWDPYYVEYHTDRGNLSRRLGDLDAALADYDRAVTLAAPFPELFYNRSVLLQLVGRHDEALADLDHLLEMEPGFLEGRVARGSLHLEQGRVENALADAQAGLAAHPDDPRLWCLAGLAQQELGALPLARDAYTAALAGDPSYAPALVDRAVLTYELGDPAGAVDDLTAALALLGEDPDVLGNRAVAYTALGRHAEALADLDRALAAPGADQVELLARRDACLAADGGRALPVGI